MKPTIDPLGAFTHAVMTPSPTSLTGPCSLAPAPALRASSTAMVTSSTPQYVRAASSGSLSGDKPEFVAAGTKANIERLVEVGIRTEKRRPPALGRRRF